MDDSLYQAAQLFNIEGEISEIKATGSGYINDSYKVTTKKSEDPNYLLQGINHNVFPDVESLMQNILDVTSCLKAELSNPVHVEIDQLVLEPILTKSGTSYVEEDGFWRMYTFFDDFISYDQAQSEDQVYGGARAFGHFLFLLRGFPKDALAITIKDFHNVIARLSTFYDVYASLSDDEIRSQVKEEIKYISEVSDDMCAIQRLVEAGSVPLRVTHNDTKFNNVLFDQNDRARCVIDLDTVMPGVVHFDFGDGIRSSASQAKEDEQDLHLVDIDMARLAAFAEGYLDSSREILTPTELDSLASSVALFPFMMGVRFLTDFLDGNKYYKIGYPDHNLARARSQFHLSKAAMKRMKDIHSSVKKFS